jgi:membrane protein
MLRKYLRRPFLTFLISMRKLHLPGFEGAGLYDVLRFLIISLSESKFNLMAAAMAYNFFFAVFPTLILIFILIPYVPVPHLKKDVLNLIANYVPKEGMNIVTSIVNEFFQKQGSGIILLNVFLALRSATRGIIAMMGAFAQHEVGRAKRRKIWNLYGTALLIFCILVALVLLSIVFMNLGIFLIKWAMSYNVFGKGIKITLLKILNFAITYLLLLFSISLTYKNLVVCQVNTVG